MSSKFIFYSLYASFLLNEVVDDLGRLFVFELCLRNATHVKQVLQVRVQVIQIKACVGIPSYMPNVPKIARGADFSFGYFLLLVVFAFGFVFPVEVAVEVDVVHLSVVLITLVVDLGVLYVHRRHWE